MNDTRQTLSIIEDDFLEITSLVDEMTTERYQSGEMTLEQLENLYIILREWTLLSEKMLNLLQLQSNFLHYENQ